MPKISELPPVGGVNTVDTLPLVQAGTTAKATFAQLPISTAVQTALDTKVNTSAVGTIASQNSNSVSITGGTIAGITDLAIADGGTGASTAAQAFTNLKQAATDTATGVVELATVAEVQAGVATTVPTVASYRSGHVVSGTAVTASGTAVDFTSIPSWVKRITIMYSGLSTNGASPPAVMIGDSGGIENTGYTGASSNLPSGGAISNTALSGGFSLSSTNATNVLYGQMTLTLMDSATNTWMASGTNTVPAGPSVGLTVGAKSLSATLDRVRLTTLSGADSFDAGLVNIVYD